MKRPETDYEIIKSDGICIYCERRKATENTSFCKACLKEFDDAKRS